MRRNHHCLVIGRRRFEREVFPIFLQSNLRLLQILLRDNGQIEQCGRIIRLSLERPIEELRTLRGALALDARQTQPIERLRIFRAEMQRIVKTFFGRHRLAGA